MTDYDDNICQRISNTGHPSGIIINMEILVDVQPFVRLFVILSVQVGCCKSNQIESHSIKLLANCIHPSLLLLETLDNFLFPTFFWVAVLIFYSFGRRFFRRFCFWIGSI